MPQAAPQAKQQTMDEALQESIAAHEDGKQEPIEAQAPLDATEGEEQPPEPGEVAGQEDPEAEEQPEVATPPKEAKAIKPTPVAAKVGKDGKPPLAKGATAPSSWPPHLREQFHALPRPVKDHILKQQGDYVRREAEYSRYVQAAKQQQESVKPLTEALSPYMPHLQAVGITPAAAVRNLFQTEYVLRTGGEPQKAAIVANLMGTYGVTPAALVAALQGKPAPEQQEQPPRQRVPEQPPKDPRLDVLLTNLQRQTQAQRAAKERQDESALQDFLASGKAEFFDDVAEEMADFAKLPRYKNLSFEQLYEKACLQNDNVRTVLEKRKADEAAALRTQKAQQARRAASSVRTEPGAPQGARRPSLDDELRRVIEAGYGPQAE
jgi:hypothetical protein